MQYIQYRTSVGEKQPTPPPSHTSPRIFSTSSSLKHIYQSVCGQGGFKPECHIEEEFDLGSSELRLNHPALKTDRNYLPHLEAILITIQPQNTMGSLFINNLTTLDLSFCPLTHSALSALVSSLTHASLPSLATLKMVNCALTDSMAPAVALAVQVCGITTLDVRAVSDDGQTPIGASLPQMLKTVPPLRAMAAMALAVSTHACLMPPTPKPIGSSTLLSAMANSLGATAATILSECGLKRLWIQGNLIGHRGLAALSGVGKQQCLEALGVSVWHDDDPCLKPAPAERVTGQVPRERMTLMSAYSQLLFNPPQFLDLGFVAISSSPSELPLSPYRSRLADLDPRDRLRAAKLGVRLARTERHRALTALRRALTLRTRIPTRIDSTGRDPRHSEGVFSADVRAGLDRIESLVLKSKRYRGLTVSNTNQELLDTSVHSVDTSVTEGGDNPKHRSPQPPSEEVLRPEAWRLKMADSYRLVENLEHSLGDTSAKEPSAKEPSAKEPSAKDTGFEVPPSEVKAETPQQHDDPSSDFEDTSSDDTSSEDLQHNIASALQTISSIAPEKKPDPQKVTVTPPKTQATESPKKRGANVSEIIKSLQSNRSISPPPARIVPRGISREFNRPQGRVKSLGAELVPPPASLQRSVNATVMGQLRREHSENLGRGAVFTSRIGRSRPQRRVYCVLGSQLLYLSLGRSSFKDVMSTISKKGSAISLRSLSIGMERDVLVLRDPSSQEHRLEGPNTRSWDTSLKILSGQTSDGQVSSTIGALVQIELHSRGFADEESETDDDIAAAVRVQPGM